MGRSQRTTSEHPPSPNRRRLPLRWVVILSLGTAVGVVVGAFGGVVAGIPAGIAAITALNEIVG